MKVFVLVLYLSYLWFGAYSSSNSKYKYDIKYFDTYLDHFTYRKSSATFKLRYLILKQYWRSGNAILFYCGNEDTIINSVHRAGLLWEFGEQLSAMIVLGEHRYYGDSLPFGNHSLSAPEYFGYLSVAQTLADYALLITFLKGSIQGAERSAVIAFGGSYGGMLAAWFRMKYPNIIAGSLASSAPILMVNNIKSCDRAYKVLTKSYETRGSVNCVDNIRRLWSLLGRYDNVKGLRKLSKIFHACEPLTTIGELINRIDSDIFMIAVANYPYPFANVSPLPKWPVTQFCRLLDTVITDPLVLFEAVFRGISMVHNYTGKVACISVNSMNYNDKAWNIQTCTELSFPMCSNGITDMFFSMNYSKEVEDHKCETMFKVEPRRDWINIEYWGSNIKTASNIIFSNGALDPWSAGGIVSSDTKSIDIISIPNGAHHIDLNGSHSDDPLDVRQAIATEKAIITNWIKQWHP